MEDKQRGYTDSPIDKKDEDFLEIKDYVDSLSDFIRKCATPMTIAIQGDWGSGKTSIMGLIKENLSDEVKPISFNTWWFSQFEMQSFLSINLLNHFISELGGNKDTKTKVAKFFRATGRSLMIGAVNKIAGDATAEKLSENLGSSDIFEYGKELKNLKDLLIEAVSSQLRDPHPNRVVFFIDDLDRLPPEKAVELLEVLKIFLDIPNCVFILAVDYNIVTKGIRKKYGEDVDEEKGRSFFDKIIQLPFVIPISQYKVKIYLTELMKNMGIHILDSEIDSYINLLESSIGFNPRSIKRLLNSFLLLYSVATKKGIFSKDDDGKQKSSKLRVLFACLCLQMAFSQLYEYILKKLNDNDPDLLDRLSEYEDLIKDNNFLEEMKQSIKSNSFQLRRISNFMENFFKAIQIDENIEEVSDEELFNLKRILSFSAITAVSKDRVETNLETEKWKKKDLKNWKDYEGFLTKYNKNKKIIKQIHDHIDTNFKGEINIIYSPSCISFRNIKSKSKQFSFANINPWRKNFITLRFYLSPQEKAPEGAIKRDYQPAKYRNKALSYSFELEDAPDSIPEEVIKLIQESFEISKLF